MSVENQEKLIEKLKLIEALFCGAKTPGEKNAASEAIGRIKERLKKIESSNPPVEYKFSLGDMWSRKLFIALLRRYEIPPFRYPNQRHTTVMACVSKKFVDEILWPEFEKLDAVLIDYLEDITNSIIKSYVFPDDSDLEVREKPRITMKG